MYVCTSDGFKIRVEEYTGIKIGQVWGEGVAQNWAGRLGEHGMG